MRSMESAVTPSRFIDNEVYREYLGLLLCDPFNKKYFKRHMESIGDLHCSVVTVIDKLCFNVLDTAHSYTGLF